MYRIVILGVALVLMVTGVVLSVMAIGASRDKLTRRDRAEVVDSASVPGTPASSNPSWLKEYTLTERSGRKFHSKELEGKVHVVNFFFASCPTSCRTQSASVEALHKEFGPQGVVFLSITCDPENDTPVALAQYAKEFHADPEQWLFLTGEMSYLRRVGGEVYFLPVDKQTHSESLLLLDKQGKIRGRFSWKDAKEIAEMKKMMTDLLAS